MIEQGYAAILDLFSSEETEANLAFEKLRAKLIRFFLIQGCLQAEDCADETIERVARKLAEGLIIQSADSYAYFRGVAAFVLKENRRQQERFESLDSPDFIHSESLQAEEKEEKFVLRERRLECLEKVLAELSEENRRLFLEYHRDTSGKSDVRTALAKELNIDVTALRNRLTRLRKKIETLVSDCVRQAKKNNS